MERMMQLEFVELRLRNFLSFGNVEQVVKLNDKSHILVTGINKDKSLDDESQKNGIGKTGFMQALHFVLFGRAIGNKVTLPNLVNNINKKHMEVTLSFIKDGINYRIERGRNPNYLHFYKEEDEITDESLGDSRDTQSVIESIIGMNEDLFCQTILLSCNVPIFMDQSTANQKMIIEKVLGVDIITKKIESLKDVIKSTKNDIAQEEFRIHTVNGQVESLLLSYRSQKEAMELEERKWEENHTKQLEDKKQLLEELNKIDFNEEYNTLKAWEHYSSANESYQNNLVNIKSLQTMLSKKDSELNLIKSKMEDLQKVDIESYKTMFSYNEQVDKAKQEYDTQMVAKSKVKDRYNELTNGLQELGKEKDKLVEKKKAYEKNVCPTCGQPLNKDVADKEIAIIDETLKQFSDAEHRINMEIIEVVNDLQTNYPEDNRTFEYKDTSPYKSVVELLNVSNEISSYTKDIENIKQQRKLIEEQLLAINVEVPEQPKKASIFKTQQEMFSSKAEQEQLKKDIANLEKETTNPYTKTVSDLEDKIMNVEYASNDKLKELQSNQEHNEILLKLLNSPSSYIRQAILDKSLEFLNSKIRYYLNKLGSLHIVKFNNDMTIDITSNGLSFGYVSSGELGRISIALTFAFRDAWENLSGIKSNLLMIDEVIDRNGLDSAGKNALVACLLENRDRNLFLVSHDSDVASHFKDKLYIVKERGFSTIEA